MLKTASKHYFKKELRQDVLYCAFRELYPPQSITLRRNFDGAHWNSMFTNELHDRLRASLNRRLMTVCDFPCETLETKVLRSL